MVTFKNRYDEEFTFTLTEEGHILWEGNFKYCRFGFPNNYTEAWKAFKQRYGVGDKLTLPIFKSIIHLYDSDSNKSVFPDILPLITSNTDVIDMVDPSGGPYIGAGLDMGELDKSFKGRIVKEFEITEKGYKIVCWPSADTYLHKHIAEVLC